MLKSFACHRFNWITRSSNPPDRNFISTNLNTPTTVSGASKINDLIPGDKRYKISVDPLTTRPKQPNHRSYLIIDASAGVQKTPVFFAPPASQFGTVSWQPPQMSCTSPDHLCDCSTDRLLFSNGFHWTDLAFIGQSQSQPIILTTRQLKI